MHFLPLLFWEIDLPPPPPPSLLSPLDNDRLPLSGSKKKLGKFFTELSSKLNSILKSTSDSIYFFHFNVVFPCPVGEMKRGGATSFAEKGRKEEER